jgi:hypothetical protein
LNKEKTVSIGISTSWEKSDERFHCFKILSFLIVSCFWAYKPVESKRSTASEKDLIITANIENMPEIVAMP